MTTPEMAQLDHGLIDVDILHKPRTGAMMEVFGPLSALAYIEVLLQLSRATNAVIEVDTVMGVARRFQIADPNAWLEYLLHPKRKMLELTPDGDITQERVVRDQIALAKNRAKWREKKSGTPTSLPPGIPLGNPPETPPGKPPDSVNTEDLNTEEIRSKKTESPPALTIELKHLDTPGTRDAAGRWQRALAKIGVRLDQDRFGASTRLYGHRTAAEFEAALLHSASGGYRNIYDPPAKIEPRNGKPGKGTVDKDPAETMWGQVLRVARIDPTLPMVKGQKQALGPQANAVADKIGWDKLGSKDGGQYKAHFLHAYRQLLKEGAC